MIAAPLKRFDHNWILYAGQAWESDEVPIRMGTSAIGQTMCMTVLVFDENLMWSVKLKSGIEGLGHEATVFSQMPEEFQGDVAIVNLGSRVFPPQDILPKLKSRGIKSIAHAGHKEKPLLLVGADCGADLVVTNGELTHKLADILGRLPGA